MSFHPDLKVGIEHHPPGRASLRLSSVGLRDQDEELLREALPEHPVVLPGKAHHLDAVQDNELRRLRPGKALGEALDVLSVDYLEARSELVHPVPADGVLEAQPVALLPGDIQHLPLGGEHPGEGHDRRALSVTAVSPEEAGSMSGDLASQARLPLGRHLQRPVDYGEGPLGRDGLLHSASSWPLNRSIFLSSVLTTLLTRRRSFPYRPPSVLTRAIPSRA